MSSDTVGNPTDRILITVRLFRSFEHKNWRPLVVKNIDPDCSLDEFMLIVRHAIANSMIPPPFKSFDYDTFKVKMTLRLSSSKYSKLDLDSFFYAYLPLCFLKFSNAVSMGRLRMGAILLRRRTIKTVLVFSVAILSVFFLVVFLSADNNDKLRLDATTKILHALGDRNTESLVRPEHNTIIYTPPNPICRNQGKDLLALFAVITSPENFDERDQMRSYFNLLEESDWRMKYKVVYFLGISSKVPFNVPDGKLNNEIQTFNDIVIDDFNESYLNLTLKTLRMLKWARSYCNGTQFLIKMDDEVHVHLSKIMNWLSSIEEPERKNNLMAGRVHANVPTILDPKSKWFTPFILWPYKTLPNYLAGFFYILGVDAREKLYQTSLKTQLFQYEDVFLTGIVANKISSKEFTRTHVSNITDYWGLTFDVFHSSCDILNYNVIHSPSAWERNCWKEFLKSSYSCNSVVPVILSCLI